MKKIILLCIVCCASVVAAAAPAAARFQDDDEDAAAVYYRDGVRYALEGRLDEAVAAFRQATRLDPENGDAFYNLGNVYAEQGRWPEAVGAYRMAVVLRKKDGAAHNGLGVALARWGEYEHAVASFKRAIEIYPEWAEPRYHLSEVYKKLGEDAAARAAYSEALKRRPDYAAHPPRTFMTEAEMARDGRAAATTNRPTPAPSNRVTTASNRGPSAVLTANAAGATPRANSPAPNGAARPEADESPYETGLRHSRAGRYEEAVAALTQAARLERNNPAAFSALGEAYARLGRWRDSVDAYEQAVRLNPRDANAYEMLGRSYAKLREVSAPSDDAGRTDAATGVRAATASSASAEAPAPAERGAPDSSGDDSDPASIYRVGPGDVLEVLASGAQGGRPTAHKVTPTGLLDYPRLGAPLKVEGLTTDEIAARLGAELSRRGAGAADAEVSVGVREYESHAIIVSGMVRDPGTKILRREGVPLYVIVAHAQPLAGAGQVLVVPRTTGQVKAVNLKDVAAMKMLVRPGDVVTVQALPKQFYFVAGPVRQPGQKEFHAGLTLTQALAASGGLAQPGASAVAVTRQGADGRLVTTRYSLRDIEAGRSPDPALQPGDRLEVQM